MGQALTHRHPTQRRDLPRGLARRMLFFALLLGTAGCIEPYDAAPQLAAVNFNQLPGDDGNGKPRDRHYVVRNGSLVIGRVLVTGSISRPGYDSDTEYWRWQPAALVRIRRGDSTRLSFELLDDRLADDEDFERFEDLTVGWSEWTCARTFTVDTHFASLSTDVSRGRFVYRVESSEYGSHPGHYFELRFDETSTHSAAAPDVWWHLVPGLGVSVSSEKAVVFIENATMRPLPTGRFIGFPLVATGAHRDD